jgi:hypothetical protein
MRSFLAVIALAFLLQSAPSLVHAADDGAATFDRGQYNSSVVTAGPSPATLLMVVGFGLGFAAFTGPFGAYAAPTIVNVLGTIAGLTTGAVGVGLAGN